MIRIPVDFNRMGREGTLIWILPRVSAEFMDIIRSGLRVILYEEHEMEVEAILGTDKDKNGKIWWYGEADWSTLKYL